MYYPFADFYYFILVLFISYFKGSQFLFKRFTTFVFVNTLMFFFIKNVTDFFKH